MTSAASPPPLPGARSIPGRWPGIAATLVAGALFGVVNLLRAHFGMRPSDSPASDGQAFLLRQWVGEWLIVCLIAVLVSLVIGGIAASAGATFHSVRRRVYPFAVVGLAVAVIILALAAPLMIGKDRRAENARMQALVDEMPAMIGSLQDPAIGLPLLRERLATTETEPDSRATRFELLILRSLERALVLVVDYEAAIEATGSDRLLDIERIEADEGFHESRLILRRMHEVVAEYHQRDERMIADMPAMIEKSGLSASEQRRYLAGFRHSLIDAWPGRQETWELEAAIIGRHEAIVDHLEESRARWHNDEGLFFFDQDEDYERFEQLMWEIRAMDARQQEIAMAHTAAFIEKLRR